MRPDPRKAFPGGVIFFIIAGILLVIGIQTLNGGSSGKVSFSHQVEHLTNLHLTLPEENRKIAQNENLVTFSGKFREQMAEESLNRYHYLELLDENHHLRAESQHLLSDLEGLKKNVFEAADLYLHVSGQLIPRAGYTVVNSLDEPLDVDGTIVIKTTSDHEVLSLPQVQKTLKFATQAQTLESLETAGRELHDLIATLRSPLLGIGSESIKQELKVLETQLLDASDGSFEQQLHSYRAGLNRLTSIVSDLGKEKDGIRLLSLRSVRSYAEVLEQYAKVSKEFDQNTSLLEKARSKVADVTWFFNNQELSTRTLEKQDPEIFGHWFSQAKQEWENFNANKGLSYRAPD
ncbi:MAG: cell division protein FtsH, partial [Chlamydiae bacterium]|nr:cell division protein FtsH [Chlamydiota bacterium]